MFRKLLILGAIVALFTIATVVPASAIAVNTGDGAKTVLSPAGPHDAHGPACGNIGGCENHDGSAAAADATFEVPGLTDKDADGIPFDNLGAWNAVWESNENSAICGVTINSPGNTCLP
jgi:hypothetical protein